MTDIPCSAQIQAIQAAAEMEVKLKKAEDKVDNLESQLAEKQGLLEDATKSLEILKNRLEQKVCGAVM
jgi:molecular chaperone GrpE (heat shock protein)